jgi:hypothetical protein
MNNYGGQVIQSFDRAPQRPRYDPTQRQGKMHAPHDKDHCEACQHGFCFGLNEKIDLYTAGNF